jgi:hypothetical protein
MSENRWGLPALLAVIVGVSALALWQDGQAVRASETTSTSTPTPAARVGPADTGNRSRRRMFLTAVRAQMPQFDHVAARDLFDLGRLHCRALDRVSTLTDLRGLLDASVSAGQGYDAVVLIVASTELCPRHQRLIARLARWAAGR